MIYLGLAGFVTTIIFAAFALFNVVVLGPDNSKAISAKTLVTPGGVKQVEKVDPPAPVAQKPNNPVPVKVAAQGNETQTDTGSSADTNPPPVSPQEQARIDKAVAALKNEAAKLDYERARYHPIHFKPRISKTSNQECLVCHSEIMTHKPRDASPAGVKSDTALAWYQTLDTYAGKQETFHFRHLQSQFAKKVMNLSCNFCHKGNDPREESPDMQPGQKVFSRGKTPKFTLRKMVNPSKTCLRCHGAFPYKFMDGVEGPWHQVRKDFEDDETPNGCLACHEETFRTNRHNVTYLKGANIEKLAKKSSDVCYGCHGGRKWYRISYPYPRHPWPDMDEETPDWAKDRPTQSEPQYQRKAKAGK